MNKDEIVGRLRGERAAGLSTETFRGVSTTCALSAADLIEEQAKVIETLTLALAPFAEAAEDTDANDDYSRSSIWEHPCAMNVTIGDLRQARRALSKALPSES